MHACMREGERDKKRRESDKYKQMVERERRVPFTSCHFSRRR